MDARQRWLIALFPLSLSGLFLTVAAGHLPPDRGVSQGAVLVAGLLLVAPSVLLMFATSQRPGEARTPAAPPTVPTTPLPSPSPHHPTLIYEHHPELGDYIYSPSTGSWTHRRATAEGEEILVDGWGRRPSDDQIQQWRFIEARLPELFTAAIASVPDPPIKPRRAEFTRDALALREVRLGPDGSFELFFDTPIGDLIDMWPMVGFTSWTIRGSEWVA